MLILSINADTYKKIKSGRQRELYVNISKWSNQHFGRHEFNKMWITLRHGLTGKKLRCEVIPLSNETGKQLWGAKEGELYWVLVIKKVFEW